MYNYFRVLYYLLSMMRRAYWSRDRLLDYQNKKVREIVKYAYDNVSFYHEKFDLFGLKPSDVTTVTDLNKLPILTKDEMRENLEKMVSKEFDVGCLRRVSTSGSTGQPISISISRREDEFRKAKHLRANISCGQKPRDRWVVIVTPQHQEEVSWLQRILRIYALTPLSVFDDPLAQVSALEKLRPDVLDGYSSSLLLIAKEAEKRGVRAIKPRLIIGGAELIERSSRQSIEEVFDAPFYDQYASIEFERMAWQCPERVGYHIDADSIVMQFVDDDGEEVAPGERGEIVCTSLFNYAMPLIRYTVGDVGVASEETDCPCGRTFPLMKVLEGRKDSLIVLPDGRILSPLVIGDGMMFYKFYRNIDQYRVIQKKIDFFKFLVKKKNDGVDENVMEMELLAYVRKLFNVDESEVTFEIEFVDDIPLDKTGKLMKVVSELKGRKLSI